MKYQRAVLITAAILALGLLVSGPALSAQGQATIERTLQVQPGGTLTVDSSFGHIKVLTASGNSVAVRVEREVRNSYSSDESRILTEHQVNISQSGNDVRVETMVSEDVRERWRDDYRGTPLRVEIVVTVPTSYNVDLDTAGGHIEVADLTGGNIKLKAVIDGVRVSLAQVPLNPAGTGYRPAYGTVNRHFPG